MSEKTGGSAFPYENEANMNGTIGMTLRDYFAAKALQGLLTQAAAMRHDSPPCDLAARVAYQYADAMLNERAK